MGLFLGKRLSTPPLALTKTLVPRPLYVIPVTSITPGKCDPSRLLRATLGTPSTLPSFYCQHSGATLPRRFRSVLKNCQMPVQHNFMPRKLAPFITAREPEQIGRHAPAARSTHLYRLRPIHSIGRPDRSRGSIDYLIRYSSPVAFIYLFHRVPSLMPLPSLISESYTHKTAYSIYVVINAQITSETPNRMFLKDFPSAHLM